MPTYEYACTACGHRLEAVQTFSDDPLTACPECRGALRKVYGAVGIVLKGSGFYKTDSRAAANGSGKKSSAGESSESSGSSGDGGGADAGSKTKTETPASSGNGSSKDAKPAPAAAG